MVAADIAKLRPADFYESIAAIQDSIRANYLGTFVKMVKGRTGDAEAEQRLEATWRGLFMKVGEAIDSRPTVLAMMADEAARFFSDWARGCQETWQGYSAWALARAGSVLKKYHEAVVKLNQAKRKGIASKEIVDAERARSDVRSLYSVMSGGGDIDTIAQDEYGKFPALGAALAALPWTWIIGIVALAVLVWGLYAIVSKIMGEPETAIVLALIGLAIVILPPLLAGKDKK